MLTLTTIVGALLLATGVVSYVVTDLASVTALIPAFVGVLLLVAALIGRRPVARRHAMHAALVVALLGALGSLMNAVRIGQLLDGTAERPAAILASVIMLVLLLVLLVAGIRSFVATRRARSSARPG